MPDDRLVHIHQNPGDVCVACGDADDSTGAFLTDYRDWNARTRKCTPGEIIDTWVFTGREDPRTSALGDIRHPHRK